MKKTRSLVGTVVLWVAGLVAFPAIGEATASRIASRATQPVRPTIRVARNAYPANSLVKVTLRVRNESKRSKRIRELCPYGHILAEVITPTKEVVYPPAFPDGPWPALQCRVPRSLSIGPNDEVTETGYVILRSSQLRAVVYESIGSNPTSIRSKPVRLHLVRSASPIVTLHTDNQVRAEISPNFKTVRGPMLYQDVVLCPGDQARGGSSVRSGSRTIDWERVARGADGAYHIQPSCARPFEWHVIAGWLNHAVASIDYSAKS